MATLIAFQPHPCFAEQEEGGSKAADILFGLAAIIAAASPMVAAAIQADADKKIAKTNANAQITMTEMSANTSKYLANQQKDIATQQAQISADISKQNQDSATKRLDMQLAELRTARQESNAVDDKKFAYQQQLDKERVQLAKEQAQETIRLANVQMRAQLTQAGLSQGFSRSQNSATGLNIASSNLGSRLGTPSSANASGLGTSLSASSLSTTRTPASTSSATVSSSVGNRAGSTGSMAVASRPSSVAKARGVRLQNATSLSDEGDGGGDGGSSDDSSSSSSDSSSGPEERRNDSVQATLVKAADPLQNFEKTIIEGKKKGRIPGLAARR